MRIGIDLGGSKIEGIVLGDQGEVFTRKRLATPTDNYPQLLNAVVQLIQELQLKAAAVSGRALVKVGIGTPGAIDPNGLMKNCNTTLLNRQALKTDLQSLLSYEIKLENDANCFALSEACYGSGKDVNCVFAVILGTGVGAGIVIDRQLLSGGPNGISGEWGHNPLGQMDGQLLDQVGVNNSPRSCYCGQSNCIETFLSGPGLSLTHKQLHGEELDAKSIAAAARNNDRSCALSLDLYCQQLAQALAVVINILDPDVIILGGGLSQIEELYLRIPKYLLKHVFNHSVATRILPPSFGDASGARGAACLWPADD